MDSGNLLPKRAIAYVHDMGVRAIDHLADTMEPPAAPEDGAAPAEPNGVQALIGHWRTMSAEEKEHFVERVAAAVVEVVAASAALPLGLKIGKRAAKATGKVIRKKTKKMRKAAKSALGVDPKKDKKKKAGK